MIGMQELIDRWITEAERLEGWAMFNFEKGKTDASLLLRSKAEIYRGCAEELKKLGN